MFRKSNNNSNAGGENHDNNNDPLESGLQVGDSNNNNNGGSSSIRYNNNNNNNDTTAAVVVKSQGGGCCSSRRCKRFQRCCCFALRFLNTFAVAILTVVVVILFIQLQYITHYVRTIQQQEIESLRHDVEHKQTQQIQHLTKKVEQQNDFTLYQMAGTFSLLTCLLTMFHITHHIRNFFEPIIQRKIIAILWMSPIYSITSFLSLIFPIVEGYLAIFKDFYEAYVIYTFLSFLIAVIGRGNRQVVVNILARRAEHLKRPTRCLSRFYYPPPETSNEAKANAVLLECQIMAMQFVFIRPITSIARFIIFMIQESNTKHNSGNSNNTNTDDDDDVYFDYGSMSEVPTIIMDDDDGNTGNRFLRAIVDEFEDDDDGMISSVANNMTSALNMTGMTSASDVGAETWDYFKSPYFIIAMVTNISVFLAFNGLLKFYHAVQEDLSWCQPFNKFLTIKGIVFLTFWQGLVINIFVSLHSNSTNNDNYDATRHAMEIQNILICLEMLFFSIAHWCVFPAEEMDPNYKPNTQKVKAGFGLKDFISDIRVIEHSAKQRKMIKKLLKQQQQQQQQRKNSEGDVSHSTSNDVMSGYAFVNDSSIGDEVLDYYNIRNSFDYHDEDDEEDNTSDYTDTDHNHNNKPARDIFSDEYSSGDDDDNDNDNNNNLVQKTSGSKKRSRSKTSPSSKDAAASENNSNPFNDDDDDSNEKTTPPPPGAVYMAKSASSASISSSSL